MQKSTFSEKFRYYFENTMSKGPAGVIKWLALVSLFMVLVLGLLILVFGIKGSLEPEAEKLGFEKIIISGFNTKGIDTKKHSIEIIPVERVDEAYRLFF